MTIFRVVHNKNYTTVNNTICKDSRLSWKAKGIWLYAYSRPDDWKFHINDLINQSTDGKDAIKAGLKELEKAGYLLRIKGKNKKGQYSCEWQFFETPQEIKNISTTTEKPSRKNRGGKSTPILTTDVASTESINKTLGDCGNVDNFSQAQSDQHSPQSLPSDKSIDEPQEDNSSSLEEVNEIELLNNYQFHNGLKITPKTLLRWLKDYDIPVIWSALVYYRKMHANNAIILPEAYVEKALKEQYAKKDEERIYAKLEDLKQKRRHKRSGL